MLDLVQIESRALASLYRAGGVRGVPVAIAVDVPLRRDLIDVVVAVVVEVVAQLLRAAVDVRVVVVAIVAAASLDLP